MTYSVDFDDLSHSLIKLDAAAEAAEAQGLLCGILCAQGRVDKASWANQVIGEASDPGNLLIREVRTELDELYQQTMEDLYDEDLGFQMFLPEDDVSLQERLHALSEWCQGFLLGFSMRSMDSIGDDTRAEIEDLVQDFVEVTRIDIDASTDDIEEENSLVEIQEYIRMGVIYIFTSLHPVATSHRLQ